MNQKKEPLVFSPKAETILQGLACGHCSCDLAISSANAIEKLLRGNSVGDNDGHSLSRNHSRGKRIQYPDKRIFFIDHPEDFPQNNKEQKISIRGIRKFCRQGLSDYLGGEEIDRGLTRRSLDTPDICDRLIKYSQIADGLSFEALLRDSPYEFGRQRLHHTRNKTLYKQKATLGSYVARAFSPDLPPIRTRKGEKGTLEQRKALIQSLPIDPDRIAEETLIKLGLAPDDFMTYTLQARRRYTLSIRGRFLKLFSEAQESNRPEGGKTARVLEITREDDQKKIAIFRTVTECDIRITGQEKPKKNYNKISKTYCSIFETREEAIRSQFHALEGLYKKIDNYSFLLDAFTHYDEFDEDGINELLTEAFEITKAEQSFYDEKLTKLLSQFVKNKNRFTRGHIIGTVYAARSNAEAKGEELRRICKILKDSQKN